jgi:hypothetical protein
MSISKKQIIVFLAAISLTLVTLFLFNKSFEPNKTNYFTNFFAEGFNFRKFQTEDKDFAKYEVGNKIDIDKLVYTDGSSFIPKDREQLFLLDVISPVCRFCELSKDIMREVKETAAQLEIGYYPVLFAQIDSNINLKEYAQSIGFEDSLRWESTSQPPELLQIMPTPAHILVNKNGTIVQVWFSSSRDEKIRRRMSEQIASDLFLIRDVYKANNYF